MTEALSPVWSGEVDARACAALWCAVILDQLRLAQGTGALPKDLYRTPRNLRSTMQEAQDWLCGRDCALICGLIGLDHAALAEEVRAGLPRAVRVARSPKNGRARMAA